jgi:moderate conductance mechanosensitive channel
MKERLIVYLNKFEGFFAIDAFLDHLLKIISILIVIIAGHIGIKLGNKFIDHIVSENNRERYISNKKIRTLRMLLKSILKYAIYFFAGLTVLSFLNVPIGSLIAGAGFIGVAVGFGAQNLVKDVINGFFILFEDQFGVGDFIKTAGVEGIVEELGLRSSRIRSFGGELHIIPNSEINQVTNYSIGNMRVLIDVGIAYEEDVDNAIEKLENLCKDIAKEKAELITDGPKVLGLHELASSSVIIRIWAMTIPMEQWGIGRYINKRVKETLDKEGIEIAYPHMVLLSKNEQGVGKG